MKKRSADIDSYEESVIHVLRNVSALKKMRKEDVCSAAPEYRSIFSESNTNYARHFTLSTFSRVLADVSTYGTPHCCARPWHSPNGTFRLSFRSHLLPTNKNGMLSSFLTRSICSLMKIN